MQISHARVVEPLQRKKERHHSLLTIERHRVPENHKKRAITRRNDFHLLTTHI
jgi:hypothetical protein